MQTAPTSDALITLGSWPDWLAALGTSLAFIIAAIAYLRSAKDSRERQARLVYASFANVSAHNAGETLPLLQGGAQIGTGDGFVIVPGEPGTEAKMVTLSPIMRAIVRVHNGSDEIMGPVKIQLWDIGHGRAYDRVTMPTGAIEPGKDYVVDMSVVNSHWPGQPALGMVIVFRDSSNRWWKRHGFEPIERVHEDPATMAELPDQRAVRAARVRDMGFGEIEPEPTITLLVRWHRLWRRARGKQPIP